NVVLAEVGPNKLKVVKAVKEACGLGLKEAKELVDGAPSTLKEGLSKAEAENLQKAIEAEGAKIELK
ncbi:MAG: ribosomal protein L7/L12, partial [Prevotella sp.]|nr:ribosomal protein L7/L12 [Prevotella sp.]